MMDRNMINSKYKTSMCRHFETTGTCHLGDRCHFAHGIHELRNVNDVPIPINSVGTPAKRHDGAADPQIPPAQTWGRPWQRHPLLQL